MLFKWILWNQYSCKALLGSTKEKDKNNCEEID